MDRRQALFASSIVMIWLAACGAPQASLPVKPASIAVTIYPQATAAFAAPKTLPTSAQSVNMNVIDIATVEVAPTYVSTVIAPTAPPAPLPTDSPVDDALDAMRQQIVSLHNQQRDAAGLTALTLSTLLQHAAQSQSDYLSNKPLDVLCGLNSAGHIGPHNEGYATRIATTGYVAALSNESWGYQFTAADAFNWWWGDTEWHRPQIIDGRLTDIGIGITPYSAGGYVFVVVYASPH